MANSNFVVQNGLTVGPATIFAGNGDVITSGNISVTGGGSFGGLSSNQIYQGTSNVNVSSGSITVGIGSSGNVATFSSTGLATTLTTASQPNVTTLAGVTSIGASGSTTITGILQTAAQTNVTSVGTLTGLTVSGAIVPNGNLTVNLGSTTAWWNNIYGTAVHSLYADLAENYQGDKAYAPGTVVMFGGSSEVTVADADTTAVAGVVSTNPAHLMNGGLTGANVVPVAFTGRVPCQIIGPVKKGDLMVSAGFGYAKASANPGVGQVIGKALQEVTFAGKAVIEVVVGRF